MVRDEDDQSEERSDDELLQLLRGNTLLVYWFLLRNNRSYTAREVQRRTGISSSSLALHHLNKLIQAELVKVDDDGLYAVGRRVKPGILSLYVGTGRLLVPRFLFYSLFVTALLFSSYFVFSSRIDATMVVLILSLSIIGAFLWFETWALWKNQPT